MSGSQKIVKQCSNNNDNESITKTISLNTYGVKNDLIGIENVKEEDKVYVSSVLHALLELHADEKPEDVFIDSFDNFYSCVATGWKTKITIEQLLSLRNLNDRIQDAYYEPEYKVIDGKVLHGPVVKIYSITHEKYANINNDNGVNGEIEGSVLKKRKRGTIGNFVSMFWPQSDS